MASYDSLKVRNLLASGEIKQVGTDAPIAIRLKYKGTGSVTSVTVTTGTNIVLVTSDGGTDTYAFATYTTVGAVVDAINADGIFDAKVLDAVRSLASATQFVNGAITAATEDGVSYYNVKVDTSAAKYFAVRLTYDRGFDKAHKASHRVHLQEAKYYATLGAAAADMVLVYKVNGTTETNVMSALSVSATETTINFASGEGKLSGANGEDIVVILKDAATLGDAAANYLRVTGIVE
jgi:hypothetical protein